VHRHLPSGTIEPSPGGSVTFEGEANGSGVSFFLVDNEPGAGPRLHRHPYSETFVVRAGTARFTVAGEAIEAGAGDILVVGPDTPHRFENVGPGRLEVTCIHASPRFESEWLDT
jgi:mannose-6-phosphate isomerase-like protein (cupin superfamily)